MCGDIAMAHGMTEANFDRIRSMPGRKVLVPGNHDIGGAGELRVEGFDEVCAILYAEGDPKLIFTHVPIEADHLPDGWGERARPHARRSANGHAAYQRVGGAVGVCAGVAVAYPAAGCSACARRVSGGEDDAGADRGAGERRADAMSGQETTTYEDRVLRDLTPLIGEKLARQLWEQGHGPPPPPDKRPTLRGAVRAAVDAWLLQRCDERDTDEALAVLVETIDLVIALQDLTDCGWLDVLQAVRQSAADAMAERAP